MWKEFGSSPLDLPVSLSSLKNGYLAGAAYVKAGY